MASNMIKMYVSGFVFLPKNKWISYSVKKKIAGPPLFFSTDSSGISNEGEIVRPKRIKKSPTDLLRALADTVGRDPTAPHYKYMDDPFFIPASNAAKRVYALSKDSGRKAAKYIVENFPDKFTGYEADPVIPAFEPPNVFQDNSLATEEALLERIEMLASIPAFEIYNNISKTGGELNVDLEHNLLELLCFYNSKNPPSTNFVDEQWFHQVSPQTQRKWVENSSAEKVFSNVKNKNARSYCALICGMAKYLYIQKAFSLFQELQDKDISIDVETYNSILKIVPFLKEAPEQRWKLVEELCHHMNEKGVKPNLKTFNTMLMILSKNYFYRLNQSLALKTLSEMKYCNIDPSAATFYYLLQINRRNPDGPYIFMSVLNYLEGKEFKIEDLDDVHFFVTAMELCCNIYQDIQLAYRLNQLVKLGKNRILLSDAFKESVYYMNFFKLLIQSEEIETVFEFYNDLVPQLYTPEPMIMRDLIYAVEICGAYHHIPRIWSDMVIFRHDVHDNVLQALINVMINAVAAEDMKDKFATIAWDMKDRLEILVDRSNVLRRYPANVLSNIIRLLVRANQFEKCWEVLLKFEDQDHIVGTISVEALKDLVKICIANGEADKALVCLTKISTLGSMDVIPLIDEANQIGLFNENQKVKVKNLLNSSLNSDNGNIVDNP